jgi:small subunit ribosomal protein S20
VEGAADLSWAKLPTILVKPCAMASLAAARPTLATPAAPRAFVFPRISVSARPLVDARASIVCEAQNSLRRQRVEERNTAYNKHYKDLVKSSSRACMKKYEAFLASAAKLQTEADLQPADQMLHTAFSNIDKAIIKGVMHKNTGARRKSKLSRARKSVLLASGLYTPEASK